MRWILRITLTLLLLVVAAVGSSWLLLRGSLPRLDGELTLHGLSEPVTIDRDRQGIPRIQAQSRTDLAFATGFVHAQERFFRMDLQRRIAAGELAALVGGKALALDRRHRLHQFRQRSERALKQLPADQRRLLEAYSQGVNQGLASLNTRPFEYFLLQQQPAPWQPADSLLTIFAMYLDLQQQDAKSERLQGVLYQLFPADIADYYTAPSPSWEAPVTGTPPALAALPGSSFSEREVLATGGLSAARLPDNSSDRITDFTTDFSALAQQELPSDDLLSGSNNWAVAGDLTTHGGAIVADDMHLSLSMPGIWYRASLVLPDRAISGLTLPGTPAMVVGSNGAIAWGFTNAFADFADVINLTVRQAPDQTATETENESASGQQYLTPDGWESFTISQEAITVQGEQRPFMLTIRHTRWGPVLEPLPGQPPQALRWVAHDQEGVNLGLLQLEQATRVSEALDVAPYTGIPGQNLMVADSSGNIGWTIMGRLPRRTGFDGRLPDDWSDGSRSWQGYLPPEQYPKVINPPQQRLWSANARVIGQQDSGELQRLGEGGYALGARAKQIRDGLFTLDQFTELDMLTMQLDNRALFLSRWQQLALDITAQLTESERRQALTDTLQQWGGRAAIDSSGYLLVRTFRLQALELLTTPLRDALRPVMGNVSAKNINLQLEDAAWQLLQQQPSHLLPTGFDSWQQLLNTALDNSYRRLTRDGQQALADASWGENNISRIRHPLSSSLGPLAHWLDMPPQPLPGDSHMPRVQGAGFGASQRMVVAPGHEDEGILHMPGGQSGHPLAPYYGAGHQAWARGEPTPFLPGPARWQLTLLPASGGL